MPRGPRWLERRRASGQAQRARPRDSEAPPRRHRDHECAEREVTDGTPPAEKKPLERRDDRTWSSVAAQQTTKRFKVIGGTDAMSCTRQLRPTHAAERWSSAMQTCATPEPLH